VVAKRCFSCMEQVSSWTSHVISRCPHLRFALVTYRYCIEMAASASAYVSLARLNKAMTEAIEVVSELHVYTVKGTSGKTYTVKTSTDNGGEGTCTCPDFMRRQVL
jgi:hypothetical protein